MKSSTGGHLGGGAQLGRREMTDEANEKKHSNLLSTIITN